MKIIRNKNNFEKTKKEKIILILKKFKFIK